MRSHSATELLDTWDRGKPRDGVERGLLLLELAEPEDTPAGLPLGERDRRLLALRHELFGARLTGLATCPVCGDQLEFECGVEELIGQADPAPSEITLESEGFTLWLRLPDSRDLRAVAAAAADEAPGLLFRRCVMRAERDGAPVAPEDLPQPLIEAAGEKLAEADRLADARFALNCFGCGQAWRAPFDAASFVWAELDAWAERMLRAVHELARAYGWPEDAILALSPARRARYLEMIGQ